MNKKLFITVAAVVGVFIAGNMIVGNNAKSEPAKALPAPVKHKRIPTMYDRLLESQEVMSKAIDNYYEEQLLIENGYMNPHGHNLSEEELKAGLDSLRKRMEDPNYKPVPIKLPVRESYVPRQATAKDLQYELDLANDKIKELELKLSELDSD